MKKYLRILFVLGKVKITFAVAISAALGYILAKGEAGLELIMPIVGVFVLACGSSALNQWQERNYDKYMDRTRQRPIPSGEISSETGFAISFAMIMTGLSVLLFFGNLEAFLLGILALAWYNGVYTFMKRKSAMAVVPGALIGSIPPAIGWVAGGGDLADPKIYALGLFFFIWQIPHFWLLVLIFDKDYQKAGYPTLTEKFEPVQLTRITYTWIVALAASCMLLPLFDLSTGLLTGFMLFMAGVWLGWSSKKLLREYMFKNAVRFAFMNINMYVLAVTLLLSLDKLL